VTGVVVLFDTRKMLERSGLATGGGTVTETTSGQAADGASAGAICASC